MVLTPIRLVVVFGRRVVIDGAYGVPTPASDAVRFTCSPRGIHLTPDVPAALPDGTGTVTVGVRVPMTAEQLVRAGDGEHTMAMTAGEATRLARWS